MSLGFSPLGASVIIPWQLCFAKMFVVHGGSDGLSIVCASAFVLVWLLAATWPVWDDFENQPFDCNCSCECNGTCNLSLRGIVTMLQCQDTTRPKAMGSSCKRKPPDISCYQTHRTNNLKACNISAKSENILSTFVNCKSKDSKACQTKSFGAVSTSSQQMSKSGSKNQFQQVLNTFQKRPIVPPCPTIPISVTKNLSTRGRSSRSRHDRSGPRALHRSTAASIHRRGLAAQLPSAEPRAMKNVPFIV